MTEQVQATEVKVAKVDKLGRTYSTGKRKESVARVWIKPGNGDIKVNGKKMTEYFQRATLQMMVNQPFGIVEKAGKYDVMATVCGGGLTGQASAIKHGISKALTLSDETMRPALKKEGFLTRDSRTVERKKPGQPKARKSFQFSKR
ncbi:MAG: 30S ribosomal protein S9 [Alphaproteobacteria bacterium]|nr:30S ribosomal protein S9 [Alphaproteobacteria bacterium]MBN2779672.1 30S ribosomal protein S9 [Alphaproteobacteria bacterium]